MWIREALHGEAGALSALAARSKAHWGYDEEFMEACVDALYPTDLSMAAVAEIESVPVGFYALGREGADVVELTHLFVEPSSIRCGVGRSLLVHALKRAEAEGFSRMLIHGDPHAEEFYLRCGAKKIGSALSESIEGRMLPLFQILIREGCHRSANHAKQIL